MTRTHPSSAPDAAGAIPRFARVWAASPGVARLPFLQAFAPEFGHLAPTPDAGVEAVIGWGLKPSSAVGRRIAAARDLPYVALEDGFLRSVGIGELGAPSLSLVIDDEGIYYDAGRPSRLERLILEAPERFGPDDLAEARRAMDRIVAAGLSKINSAPPLAPDALPPKTRRRVLVVDQTAGDASIRFGLAEDDSFRRMLEAAVRDEPDAEIWVRRHPVAQSGAKSGALPAELPYGVRAFEAPCRAADLIDQVDAVYAVTSLMGFEALLRGKPVRLFGAPFYAGWGLTRDEVPVARRGVERSLEQVFAAAYMAYTRYVDPVTGEACDIHRALDRLLLFRERADRFAGFTAAVGFAPWKHRPVRTLLWSPRGELRFYGSADRAAKAAEAKGGRVVYWAARETPKMRARLDASSAPALRMEDGFVRSSGLGSDFFGAASVSLDDQGIYYDPSRPSRLETILQTAPMDAALAARAARLRKAIVKAKVSKYNLRADASEAELWPEDLERVLVVGQVENDQSILKGCEDVRTNAELLRRARAEHPEAFIVYKEHPDVVAGNRPGALPPDAAALADARADDLDAAECLDRVDRLVTMTSLAGFEALLRGVTVRVFGRPFYAGWGLTEDALPIPRRTRRLTVDQLAAGALILYPIYVSPRSGLPCEPEDLVAELAAARPPAVRRGPVAKLLRAAARSLRARGPPKALY